jgi:Voltage gated chloride channel
LAPTAATVERHVDTLDAVAVAGQSPAADSERTGGDRLTVGGHEDVAVERQARQRDAFALEDGVGVGIAVATSCIATVTAWPVSHGDPTFVWPDTQYSWTSLLFTVALMPVAAAVGTGFNGLIRRARPKSPPASWTLLVTIGLAGLLTGACSIWMPQMPGNGKSIIVESLAGGDTLIAVTVAMVLKPVLTALFIRAGAVGGMLTPSLATGVATGASLALLVERLGGCAGVRRRVHRGTHPSAAADLGHVAAGRGRRTLCPSPRRPTPAARKTRPRPSHTSDIANADWFGMTWRLVDGSC